jgi:DNA-directed RNA polymerase specialized sigma24 family protein
MDALPREGSGGRACQDSPTGIHEEYAGVLRACRFAGLTTFEAEDVAQDIFLWLLQRRLLIVAPDPPWLAAVIQNFIRRYRHEKGVRQARESRAAAEAAIFPRRGDSADSLRLHLSIDEIERHLPKTEARLLRLVRQGCSLAEGAKRLGIPRGSHSFFRKRLIAHVTEGFHPAPLRRQPG